jgi:hypothetical protein
MKYLWAGLVVPLFCTGAVVPALAAPPAKAPPAPAPAAPPAATPPSRSQPPQSYGSGTLSLANGNYQFAPQGCTHNGNRAICNFYVTYSGAQQGNVNAWAGYYGQWTMNVQLVDSLHVPHGPDTSYFIDATGAHQPMMFIQQGTQVWLAVEFPNVDFSVTSGEFHMGNQIVGGVAIVQPQQPQQQYAAAPSAPQQQYAGPPSVPQQQYAGPPSVPQQQYAGPPSAPQQQYASNVQSTQAPTAPPLNCTPGTVGYSGAALCNVQNKMNVAQGWKQLLSGFAPAPQANPQPQMQPPPPGH